MDLQDNQVDTQIDTKEQLQQQPEPQPEQLPQQEHQEKHKHTNILAVVLFFLLLVFGGGGIYLALSRTNTEDQPVNKEVEEVATKTQEAPEVNSEINPEEPEENIEPYLQDNEVKKIESEVISTVEVLSERMDICTSYSDKEYTKQLQCFEEILDSVEDTGLCEYTEFEEAQSACTIGLAVRTKYVDICDEFKNTPCYTALAKELNKAILCEKISNEDIKQSCFSEVAVSTQDIDVCERITKQRTREYCYRDVAVEKKDSELCKKIQADYISEEPSPSKTSCNYAVAAVTGDIDLCGEPAPADIDKAKYGNYARQNSECFDNVAVNKENKKAINDKTEKGPIMSINFPDKLDLCVPYSEIFQHPFGGEMRREILGEVDGKCKYEEEMPGGGKMLCAYNQETRKAIAQYYRDVAAAESAGTEMGSGAASGETVTKYTLDGKEVENPLSEAMINGTCIITGYSDMGTE